MATYKQIQTYVREHDGSSVKTCWIAHVKADHGLTSRIAHNRASNCQRTHPCPKGRRPAIEAALRHFGMIRGAVAVV